MDKQQAAKLLSQVQKAGARHSRADSGLVQQLHDLACQLGAECKAEKARMLSVDDLRQFAPNPMLKAKLEALCQKL